MKLGQTHLLVGVLCLFLGGWAGTALAAAPTVPTFKPPRVFDEAQVRAAGLRRLNGKHLTLYTDLPAGPAVDELPALFDLAFPQWCAYFQLDEKSLADWRVNGFLMGDQARFKTQQMLPDKVPRFLNGYALDHEIWMNEQKTDYYRRHLVLHEGVHALMRTQLGSCGPPWYMEGMAELLGTHRWQNGKLTVGTFPVNKEEAPGWGRVKIIKDDLAKQEPLSLSQVFAFPGESYLRNEPYGWSWGAATFLNAHPRYRERFRELSQDVLQTDFNQRVGKRFKKDWPAVCEEWQLFIGELEYGYDLSRAAVEYKPGQTLPANGTSVAVAADRGWQSAGIKLEAGKTYRLTATGKFQLAQQPKPWWSEANGVSIRYYRGLPLGLLLAAVRPDDQAAEEPSPLLKPISVGLNGTLTPQKTGTLYLRVNDSAAELADNSGSLQVEVKAQ